MRLAPPQKSATSLRMLCSTCSLTSLRKYSGTAPRYSHSSRRSAGWSLQPCNRQHKLPPELQWNVTSFTCDLFTQSRRTFR